MHLVYPSESREARHVERPVGVQRQRRWQLIAAAARFSQLERLVMRSTRLSHTEEGGDSYERTRTLTDDSTQSSV